jgi:hypothetical protein
LQGRAAMRVIRERTSAMNRQMTVLLMGGICLGCGASQVDATNDETQQVSSSESALQSGGQFFCNTTGPGRCTYQNIRINFPKVVFHNPGGGALGQTKDFQAARADNQHWDFVNVTGNRYRIQVHNSTDCIWDPSPPADGDMLLVGNCSAGGLNAQFTFTGDPATIFKLQSVGNPNLCITTDTTSFSDASPLRLRTCTTSLSVSQGQTLSLDDLNLPHCAYVGNDVAGNAGQLYFVDAVYHGGWYHPNNPILLSQWGPGILSSWNTFSANAQTFFANQGFWNRLAEYGQFTGSLSIAASFPTQYDGTAFPSSITDDVVVRELTARINRGDLPATGDEIYAIQLTGALTDADNDGSEGGSHGAFTLPNGKNLRYVVMNSGGPDSMMLIDHEVSETVTDSAPPTGVFVSQFARVDGTILYQGGEGEIGDLCNRSPANIAGQVGEKVWSQATCQCISNPISSDMAPQRIHGDFDGRGKEDLIVVSNSGSSENVGQTAGGFTNPWTRTDLTLGGVSYVPGDFNGDGVTDVIVVNNSGSFEYAGIAGGGFTPNVWVRTDLPYGKTRYIAGDFNGDGTTDLIIVTRFGSFEYTGIKNGQGFNENVWVRSDLALGSVGYTAGDFNGDGYSDLIVTTGTGSTEIAGQVLSGFSSSLWTRPDLPLGQVKFVAGNFNGDLTFPALQHRIDDLLIVTQFGTYQYNGRSWGGFDENMWVREDLTITNTSYVAGDFNGDGFTDFIVTTPFGSFEYTGISPSGFIQNVWFRPDLTLGAVSFFRGDFDGDRKDDLIITTSSGSSEVLGQPVSGFSASVWFDSSLSTDLVQFF